MINFFAKRLNKKGFTLAELLIVIAIIAILVAIALPIFANYLGGARIAVHESNARAIKTMAIKELLSPSDKTIDEYGHATLATILESLQTTGKAYATGQVVNGKLVLTGLSATATNGADSATLGVVKASSGDYVDVSSDEAGAIDVHQDTLDYEVVIDSTEVTY